MIGIEQMEEWVDHQEKTTLEMLDHMMVQAKQINVLLDMISGLSDRIDHLEKK